jgi:hypothetical protein
MFKENNLIFFVEINKKKRNFINQYIQRTSIEIKERAPFKEGIHTI